MGFMTVGLFVWLLIGLASAMYFLPTIIALVQHRRNAGAVALINILLGWSFVGWVVALVLALTGEPQPVQIVHVHQQIAYPQRTAPGASIQTIEQQRRPGTSLMED